MPVLANHVPEVHDQLEYLTEATPSTEAAPIAWRTRGFDPIDWSGTRARNRRFNNAHPAAPTTERSEIRWWNSGYFAAVLVSPRHALVCGHYRRAVPSQVHSMRFIGRSGFVRIPKVAKLIEGVGEDLDLVEFADELPANDYAIANLIADLLTAERGLELWFQSAQHTSFRMTLDQVASVVETNGAKWAMGFTSKVVGDGYSEGAGEDGKHLVHSGDSGSPIFCRDRWGRQCLVGLGWGSPTIGMRGKDSAASREFETVRDILAACGHPLEAADVSRAGNPDLDGDGAVDARDLSIVTSEWGRAHSRADIDGDGTVGARDLSAVLAGWSRP